MKHALAAALALTLAACNGTPADFSMPRYTPSFVYAPMNPIAPQFTPPILR